MGKIWSELPHKSYIISVHGRPYGIGMHPIWDDFPGAWNILSVMWPQMEELLNWTGEPGEFPLSCGYIPFAVGMSMQMATKNKTWGILAEELTPAQWAEAVKAHPGLDNFILPVVFGPVFWGRIKAKIEVYMECPTNVIRGNFGRAGGVH